MCGINGIFPLGGKRAEGLALRVETMNDLIRHRGPDDEGVWSDPQGYVCLGHRRLSIIELSRRGHQPMVLPDGTAIVFNGEIYNFRELKKALPDFDFQSDSDTELILALYQQKGADCVDDLIGQFAFVIWDPKKRGLFIARDRIGKKPFYFTSLGGNFAFSSEIRSLLSLPYVKGKLDEKAFYYFLTFGFVPPPMTMFDGIAKLEQGHSLWVDENGVGEPKPYWSVKFQDTPNSETELIDAIRQQIERSMDLRMVSDVPVGIFLSGGVDSTGIATMMKARTDNPVRSFSISFADQPDYDEAADARATAKRLGLDHHERVVTRDDMRKMIGDIVGVLDEPLADPTCIPIYFLSEMASQKKTKVVLTGDGPDELLLGYRNWRRYYKAYPWFRRYSKLPGVLKSAGLSLGRKLTDSPRMVDMLYRANRGQEMFWGSASSFRESEKTGLLHPEFAERARQWDCHDVVAGLRADYDRESGGFDGSDPNWMAYLGLRFMIPNFYMHRADRLGMHHSVELRAPFLDHNFVNLALSIRSEWKIRNNVPKYILKRAFEGLVPDKVLYQQKKGFCVPLREWGEDIMVSYIMENLDEVCSKSRLLNKQALIAQVEEFKRGNSLLADNMWTLYFLIAWMQRWITD